MPKVAAVDPGSAKAATGVACMGSCCSPGARTAPVTGTQAPATIACSVPSAASWRMTNVVVSPLAGATARSGMPIRRQTRDAVTR